MKKQIYIYDKTIARTWEELGRIKLHFIFVDINKGYLIHVWFNTVRGGYTDRSDQFKARSTFYMGQISLVHEINGIFFRPISGSQKSADKRTGPLAQIVIKKKQQQIYQIRRNFFFSFIFKLKSIKLKYTNICN